MRHSDPNGQNLFQRMFSFPSRIGHDPLENYLTEVLVWCLQRSDLFAPNVLRRLNFLPLKKTLPALEISTQTGFRNETDESNKGGVFDIVIRAQDNSFLLVIEVKTWWQISEQQLRKYRDELFRSKEYKEVDKKHRYLVALTNWNHQDKNLLHGQLKWSTIVELLSESRIKKEPFGSVLKQLREYVILKGLGPMKLHSVDGKFSKQCYDAYHFRDNLEKILESVKTASTLKEHFLHKKVEYYSKDGDTYLGIYGKNRSVLGWYGFHFHPSSIEMTVELVRNGNFTIPKKAKKVFPFEWFIPSENETWINCVQELNSSNSNEDFMRTWFVKNCKAFIDSQELLGKG